MKQDLLSKILVFAVGAGIGSGVTYKILKTKYDTLIQEEINSVKESFSRINNEATVEEPKDDFDGKATEEEIEIVEDVIRQNGYTAVSDNGKVEEDVIEMTEPYVISPEEFGECDYATITLWYYTDGTVTNDNGKIIKNVEELIGNDFANHFGDYEEDPDAVYVRNEDQEVDYEVLKEYRSYSDVY